MAWKAVCDAATGRLISVGDVVADPLPDGVQAVELLGEPDLDSDMWDEGVRGFVARPPKVLVDRLAEILTHADYADFRELWSNLPALRRQQLRNAMIRLLGRARYRSQSESLTIEPEDA